VNRFIAFVATASIASISGLSFSLPAQAGFWDDIRGAFDQPPPPHMYLNFSVLNQCSETVIASVQSIPAGKENWEVREYRIAPGERPTVAVTDNKYVYVSARLENRSSPSWERRQFDASVNNAYNLSCSR